MSNKLCFLIYHACHVICHVRCRQSCIIACALALRCDKVVLALVGHQGGSIAALLRQATACVHVPTKGADSESSVMTLQTLSVAALLGGTGVKDVAPLQRRAFASFEPENEDEGRSTARKRVSKTADVLEVQ